MKRSKLPCCIIFLMLASSCSLLPVEEVAPPPPLVRSYEKAEYKLFSATNGDILDTLRISCQYSPALEQSLSFPIGGVIVDSVHVSVGDTVTKGDLIAALERADIVEKIDRQNYLIEKLKLERDHMISTHKLNLEMQNILQNRDSAEALTESHKLKLDIINKQIAAEQYTLNELQTQNKQRLLYAGIDGTVTFLKETGPYTKSTENEKFVTISDKTTSLFLVSGKNSEHFVPGQVYNIVISNNEHEAICLSPSDLGLEHVEDYAYLRLVEPILDLKERTTGTIIILLDSRVDTLYVPSSTVKSANGQTIVYTLDDSGFKTVREVEVGFVADGKAEILSGLESGESVIID